jgi:hypothetical protein
VSGLARIRKSPMGMWRGRWRRSPIPQPMARTQQSRRRKSHGASERWRDLGACPNLTVYRLLEAHLWGGFKKRRRRPEVASLAECQVNVVHCAAMSTGQRRPSAN